MAGRQTGQEGRARCLLTRALAHGASPAAPLCAATADWFNKPIALPVSMESDYRKLMAETNDRLLDMGCPPERDWAVFSPYFSDEDLWRSASPLSRILHEQLRRHDSVAPVGIDSPIEVASDSVNV